MLTRQVLAGRWKELVGLGKGNKPNACRALEALKEEKLFNSVCLEIMIPFLSSEQFGTL